MRIDFATYRRKVLGCWLGKAVGGTLGGPWEGHGGPHHLTYYEPLPSEMLPNDDLDLQVVWLETIRRHGLPVDRGILARAWLENVHFWPDEYGVAARNLTLGVMPPASGAFDNGFTAGMGSAIRSELWACLAPGDPALAARLALEDACVDHAGEGLHAEVFLAVLESAAFVEADRDALLDRALAAIPSYTRVARAISDTRAWWRETGDWLIVRQRVLEAHGCQNFTDVAQNLAFAILGWLAGGGDFGRAICTAVNCGKDADCSGATLGALLGILDPDRIGPEWLKPIGRDLVLSPGVVGMHQVATLDDFTDQVAALAGDVLRYYGSETALAAAPALAGPRRNMAPPRLPPGAPAGLTQPVPENEALLATEPLIVTLVYPHGVALVPGQKATLRLRLSNPSDRRTHRGTMVCHVPDGWDLEAGPVDLALAPGASHEVTLSVCPCAALPLRSYLNTLDVRFAVDGLTWTVSAGLPLTMPWRRWRLESMPDACPALPAAADCVEAQGHSVPLLDGTHALAIDVKLSSPCRGRWIVQAARPVRSWLDGVATHDHDGTHRVPAVHRAGPTGVDVQLSRGWHHLVVAVGQGSGGALFFGLGDGQSWDWLRDAEFRWTMSL
jgi:ADP-ribosylglycohydrolase